MDNNNIKKTGCYCITQKAIFNILWEAIMKKNIFKNEYVHISSVAQSFPALCDPIDCSTPVFPVHHQLLDLAQTHVHQVGDVIQPSHPLSSPFPPTFNLSQHQGRLSSLHQVLEFRLQHQSFQWIFRTDLFPLGWTSWISLQSKGLSRVFSDTTVQKHQFFSAQLSLRSSHIHTWLLENTQYYCLENSMDRGAWWAIVHGDAELGMI